MGSLRSPMACKGDADAVNDPSRVNERLVPVRVVLPPTFLAHLGEELSESVELLLSK